MDNDLKIDIDVAKDPSGRGDRQTIEVTVNDADTDENIAGANVDGTVKYATNVDYDKGNFDGKTNSDGKIAHKWKIGGGSNEGTFNVIVKVTANGYNSKTETTSFEVVDKDKLTNNTGPDNSTSIVENSSALSNENSDESNDDVDCKDIDEKNITVGDNDPNNLDNDGDGIGCESNDDNGGQTNNEESEEPKTDDETAGDSPGGIDDTETGDTTDDSSDSDSEQTDGDDDGVNNEQPEDNGDNGGNGGDNQDQDPNENDSDENGEEEGGDEDANSDQSDGDNNN